MYIPVKCVCACTPHLRCGPYHHHGPEITLRPLPLSPTPLYTHTHPSPLQRAGRKKSPTWRTHGAVHSSGAGAVRPTCTGVPLPKHTVGAGGTGQDGRPQLQGKLWEGVRPCRSKGRGTRGHGAVQCVGAGEGTCGGAAGGAVTVDKQAGEGECVREERGGGGEGRLEGHCPSPSTGHAVAVTTACALLGIAATLALAGAA
jgi:hypothetical protein